MKKFTSIIALVFISVIPALLWAQANLGEVQIYIFSEGGEPLSGVEARLEDKLIRSDENGLINFTQPQGTHTIPLYYRDQVVSEVSLTVRQGRVTEAIVTARSGGAVQTTEQDIPLEDDAAKSTFDPDGVPGTLKGTILGIEAGKPVPLATIVFRGLDIESRSDETGSFEVTLPEGTYTFSVIHPDFSTQTINDVLVEPEQVRELTVELTPQAVAIAEQAVFAVEEVRVEGGIAKLIEEMADSDAVISFMGAEQISRSGDSDAASALKRITGLTIVDGRFVYVRGMGERYSSSYLNGSLLPSPEVDKRVVPLDLFPASIIESLAVQKTYDPTLPGQFGGGGVGITTIGLPDDQYKRRLRTDLSFSLTYNDGTTFQNRLYEEGGKFDFLGFDDGTRKLPSAIENSEETISVPSGAFGGGYSDAEREAFGETFPLTWSPVEKMIPLDYSASVSVRDKIELGTYNNFGYTASMSIKDSWSSTDRVQTFFEASNDPDELGRPIHKYDFRENSRDIDVGTILELVFEDVRSYRLESSSLLVRATDSVTEKVSGEYGSEQYDIGETELRWTEQTLFNQALRGEHRLEALNGVDLNWNYNFSFANSYMPDRRYYVYREDDEDGTYVDEDGYLAPDDWSNRRIFNETRDFVHDGGASLSLPVNWFGNASEDFLDLGVNASYQTRSSNTRRFGFDYDDAGANEDTVKGDPNLYFTPENIGPDGIFDFLEYTESTDSVSSSQLVLAGFFNLDAMIFGNTRLSTGLRVEWSRQQVNTFNFFSGDPEEPVVLQSVNALDMLMPALNLTVPTGDDSQLRIGVSGTVNRPDLNELSPTIKNSGTPGSGSFQGNPELQIARLYNGDIRWESYIGEKEFFSIGAFYKYFQNPIETFSLNRGGGELLSTYASIPSAQNLGAELEWQLTGRFIGDGIRSLALNVRSSSMEETVRRRKRIGALASFFRDLSFIGNFAYIYSQINPGEGFQFVLTDPNSGLEELKSFANTNNKRPLEGQSPYVLNASLGYKNSVSWSQERDVYTSVFLNYHVFGPRISGIGTNGVPDVYEQPFHSLDLVFRQSLSLYLSFSFTAKNLLNPLVQTTLGPERLDNNLVESYKKGRSFGLSMKLSL